MSREISTMDYEELLTLAKILVCQINTGSYRGESRLLLDEIIDRVIEELKE